MIWHIDYRIPSQVSEIKTNRITLPVVNKPSSLELKLVTSYPGTEVLNNVSDITVATIAVASIVSNLPINYDALIEVTWHTAGDGIFAGSEGFFAPNLSFNISDMVMASAGYFTMAALTSFYDTNMTAASLVEIYLNGDKKNWIAWSDIGSLNFEITKKNVAGEAPLDWAGRVSNIYKLGTKFVVAGENGVSFVTPVGKFMGLNTLHRIGLLGRDAYAGTDYEHFFVDKLGCLYQLDDTLHKLDYREYLSGMINPVLTLDPTINLLYICDGTNGYVYSIEDKSMGECAPNITGTGYKNGILYITAPAAIAIPSGSIITDIYDFGTRKRKTIRRLEVSTDILQDIAVAVDYRLDKSKDFSTTSWKTVSAEGRAIVICKGVDFRFRAKVTAYEDFGLDDFKIIAMAQVR